MTRRDIASVSKSDNEKIDSLNKTTAMAKENSLLENSAAPLQKEQTQIYYPHELGITCIESDQVIIAMLRR